MQLFVGLGNPGAKYEKTRHNIGFMAIDAIAANNDFSPERKQFQGLSREGRFGSVKTLLLKPQTFMNESGRAVSEAARFYKIDPENIVVFHDELDLVPGKLRVKTAGGHAGHNGLRSIHAHIGDAYRRVRLGIGHPGQKSKVTGYVLGEFAKAERDWLDSLLDGIARHAVTLADGEDERFQSDLAQYMQSKDDRSDSGRGKPSDDRHRDSARATKAGQKSSQSTGDTTRSTIRAEDERKANGPFAALTSIFKGNS